ncbi:hypothetical protein ABBQ32_011027 [Trebouxia sp. C0010 RCD-2024]
MLLSQRRCGPTQDQSRCRDTPSGLQQTTVSVQRAVLTPGRLRVSRCSCAGLGQRRPCRGLCVSIRTGTVRCCGAKLTQQAQVVVTREAGRNGKLKQALQDCDIAVLELPLVETKSGPDRDQLAAHLKDGPFDWVVITSPQAANVFLQGWIEADKPQVRIAVVGPGTGDILTHQKEPRLQIDFTPLTANAVSLSAELPCIEGGTQNVLYPSSAKAGSDLQTGLKNRGFEVVRLNTYDTQPVTHVEESVLREACHAAVVAFASPSAVKAWRRITAGRDVADIAVACIGSTTAIAAEKQGFQRLYFPDQPGIKGFVSAIIDALNSAHATRDVASNAA